MLARQSFCPRNGRILILAVLSARQGNFSNPRIHNRLPLLAGIAMSDNNNRKKRPFETLNEQQRRRGPINDDDEEEEEEGDDEENGEHKNNELDAKRDNKSASSSSSSKKWEPYRSLPAYGEHRRAVSSVKLAPSALTKNRENAALAASASADGSVKIWDLQDAADGNRRLMTSCHTLLGHSRGINEVSWNPLTPHVATASDDKTVRLWDAVTSEALVEFRGHDNFVFCVDQHHAMIVSGSFDETVKLWDIRSGDCVSTLPAHSDPVTAVGFNRDGTCVCSASHDGLIRIWDVATGECLKTIYAAGNPPVSSVRYSPNSKYLLAGTLDSTLRLWPVTKTGSNKCSKTYKSPDVHVNTKYSMAADFMYDGNIVTGSETGKIIIYDLQTRQVLQQLEGHEDAVLAVSAHDTLPLLCSGAMTADRRVEFWSRGGGGGGGGGSTTTSFGTRHDSTTFNNNNNNNNIIDPSYVAAAAAMQEDDEEEDEDDESADSGAPVRRR